MKPLRLLILILLAGLFIAPAQAQQYANWASTKATVVCPMQSTSVCMTPNYRGRTVLPEADCPMYITALSGDLNPFDASTPKPRTIRKAPPGTGGDKDNPEIEGALPDGTLFLMLMAASAVLSVALRRRKAMLTQPTELSEK